MRKAFTLMELVVALAILAVMLSFAGVIFRVSIESHRLALANAEIMQKLRVITDQLDADFRSLRKDGEIFVVWTANRKPNYAGANPNSSLAFERFDRIMFFTTGDFQTYGPNPQRGNVARICYTLARGPSADPTDPNWPQRQKPHKRILARTQHILIPPADPDEQLDVNGFTSKQWLEWNSRGQVDRISLEGWKRIPLRDKCNMLSVIGDITVVDAETRDPISTTTKDAHGVLIDRSDPNSFHALFCRGVGQFMVQGWYDAQGQTGRQDRWMPQVNPDEDDELDDDSDFILTADGANLDPNDVPALRYPRGGVNIVNAAYSAGEIDQIDEEHFNQIPGLGRALKFTFTLYDSRNLIKNGRTFTHIVYLDN